MNQLRLSDPPTDSDVLAAVYNELKKGDESMTLKSWFEQKSGKWGEDESTKLTLKALVDRGVLSADGLMGDAFNNAKFKVKDQKVEDDFRNRLMNVVNGEAEADGRSVALLALCRTADRRDPNTNLLMTQLFGKDAGSMTPKVDALVEKCVKFQGIGAEEVNKMIEVCPGELQQFLLSKEFKDDAAAQFQELSGGKGHISPEDLSKKIDKDVKKLIKDKLGVIEDNQDFEEVLSMFDKDSDDKMDEDNFTGFLMWCHALNALET